MNNYNTEFVIIIYKDYLFMVNLDKLTSRITKNDNGNIPKNVKG